MAVDRRRIVTLGFARHAHPREVMHAHRHAQGRLPIALTFVTGEIEIPVGHAVQFTGHSGAAILTHRTLRLLGRRELDRIAQHVDARQLEATVAAHRIADRADLAMKRLLLHQMSGERDAVFFAPAAESVGKSCRKTLRAVVMIAPARQ